MAPTRRMEQTKEDEADGVFKLFFAAHPPSPCHLQTAVESILLSLPAIRILLSALLLLFLPVLTGRG